MVGRGEGKQESNASPIPSSNPPTPPSADEPPHLQALLLQLTGEPVHIRLNARQTAEAAGITITVTITIEGKTMAPAAAAAAGGTAGAA